MKWAPALPFTLIQRPFLIRIVWTNPNFLLIFVGSKLKSQSFFIYWLKSHVNNANSLE